MNLPLEPMLRDLKRDGGEQAGGQGPFSFHFSAHIDELLAREKALLVDVPFLKASFGILLVRRVSFACSCGSISRWHLRVAAPWRMPSASNTAVAFCMNAARRQRGKLAKCASRVTLASAFLSKRYAR